MLFNSPVTAPQNVPIANFTQGSWKDFDVHLSLIGCKEMIWKTLFRLSRLLTRLVNKKVLLRERKRHTARRVANALSVGWGWGWGGTPSSHDGGEVPYPVMVGKVPHPVMVVGGYPRVPPPSRPGQGRYTPHHPDLAGGYPPTIQTWSGEGYPHHPDLAWGVTPGTPPPS